ncbi:MAG: D-2-hydroxyacid dehydrogenase [Gemmatimonadota bacterium]
MKSIIPRRFVLNFNDERSRWAVTDAAADRIAAALPSDWELVRLDAPVSSRGDGGTMISDDALEAVADAEIYVSTGFPPPLLRAAKKLKWVHTGAAGVRSLLYPEMVAADVMLTNSAGIHAEPMAETVLAMALFFSRGLDFAVRSQTRGEWDQSAFETVASPVIELGGQTIGMLGFGGIGRAVARRAEALGMRVLATRAVEVERILRESDVVVVALPATPHTRGMIGARELALMKARAVLINVARGEIVDESALIDALTRGAIRGAGLDVFEHEPLAADSPLWRLPNALLLPHVSAITPRYWERQADLIVDNLGRYLRGEPLRNVVDKQRGY